MAIRTPKSPNLGGYLHHLEHYFGIYFEVSVLNFSQNLANSHRWQFNNGWKVPEKKTLYIQQKHFRKFSQQKQK